MDTSMRSLENIERDILKGIRRGVEEFRKSPFRFLFESDIQAMLFSHLRDCVPDVFSVPKSDKHRGWEVLGLIYSEYMIYDEYRPKIDLVCIDPGRASRGLGNIEGLPGSFIYNLPVHIGLEIKYRKIGDIFRINSCVIDLEKLQSLKNNQRLLKFIVMGFLQEDGFVDDFFKGVDDSIVRIDVNDIKDLNSIYLVTPSNIFKYKQMTLVYMILS